MNIVEHVFLLYVEASLGYMSRSGLSGSSVSSRFSFLRNHQNDYKSSCTSLQSYQQWRIIPLSHHPCQQLQSSDFLILAILVGVRWNLRVDLICISLMANDVEHFLRCFSAIRYSSIENFLFSSVPHFLIGLFDSLVSIFLSSLYILDIRHLSDVGLVKIFSYSVGCRFVFLTVSLALQKLCNLIQFYFSILGLRE